LHEIHYFKDAPAGHSMPELPPNFVMHSKVEIFGTMLAITDGGEKPLKDSPISFIIMLTTPEAVTSTFNKLAEGGIILQPLEKQFWAELCCTVEDKFGVGWHILTDK